MARPRSSCPPHPPYTATSSGSAWTSFFVNSPRQVDTGTINTGYTFVTATVRPRLRDGGCQFPVGLCPGCPGPAVRRRGPGGHHRRHEGRDHYDDDIRVPQPALQSMQSCQPERSGDDSIEKIHSELLDDRYRLCRGGAAYLYLISILIWPHFDTYPYRSIQNILMSTQNILIIKIYL